MAPVTIDPELVAKLTANGGLVPLTDASGTPVGYFLSPEEYARMKKACNDWMYQEPTLEEFRRALADPKRYTTEEVMKLLEDE